MERLPQFPLELSDVDATLPVPPVSESVEIELAEDDLEEVAPPSLPRVVPPPRRPVSIAPVTFETETTVPWRPRARIWPAAVFAACLVGSVGALFGGMRVGGSLFHAAAARDARRASVEVRTLERSIEEAPREPDPPPAVTAVAFVARRVAPASAKTGVIRVSPSVRGMLVDGAPTRVTGGAVVVACGHHTTKTSLTPSRGVDVPCGGTAWVF